MRGLRSERITVTSGFTLVEVVVSLSLLSLVLLGTVTALRTFANTQTSLVAFSNRVDEVRTVSGLLRDTLQASVVIAGDDEGLSFGASAKPQSYFEGSENAMVWKAPVIFGESYGGSVFIRVAMEKDQLVLRWQEPLVTVEPEDWSASYFRVLVEEFEELTLSYRGAFGAPWQARWDGQGSPAHVRLGIKAHGRYWPDLIMEVQR